MTFPALMSSAAALVALVMAAVVLFQDRGSNLHRIFAVGMLLLAGEEVLRAIGYAAATPKDAVYWQHRIIILSALVPAAWLAFSLGYARVNAAELLSRWKWILLGTAVAPVPLLAAFGDSIFADAAYVEELGQWSISLNRFGIILQIYFLVSSVLILFNIERTIRSSIGRMRWQIKFMALGVGGLFALRIFLSSQSLLFSAIDTQLGTINAMALIAASVLFALTLARGRSLNVDVYLSTATIRNSLTVFFVGVYLVAVGLLGRLAQNPAADRSLPLDALIVFVALMALAILLLSNRLRRKFRFFVSRHFRRPIYDFRNVWMDLTARTTSMVDVGELSTAVCKMVSETLDILSVSVWLVDDSQRKLTLSGSTALSARHAKELERCGQSAPETIAFLRNHVGYHDLKNQSFQWPLEIERALSQVFEQNSMSSMVGLHAGGELVGVMTLNDDRVGGEKTLSSEDTVLLETLAAQLAAGLLNLKLTRRVRQARELEAFQTVSTFFVHDLKNVASRLSLTMQNLPSNFDNPEFRQDALRVISGSLSKIDEMCGRLAMLKKNVELNLSQNDLNKLVTATLNEFRPSLKARVEERLSALPGARLDYEQIQKVLTNLIMNANDAVNGNGVIRIETTHENGMVGFAVSDNGCGMTGEFIESKLFRPFQTTKKKGLGIGLFHSKQIVEAHQGTFEVTSKPGAGSEFRVSLPTDRT